MSTSPGQAKPMNHVRTVMASAGLTALLAGLVSAAMLSTGPSGHTQPPAGMVSVPAGEFTMGSQVGDADAQPTRKVYVGAFYIDKYETTNAQYVQFLNTVGGPVGQCEGHRCLDTRAESTDSHIFWEGRYRVEAGYEQHPVTNLSWYGARAYCRYHGKRLPTEAEWEKAARGTDGRSYPWGDQLDPRRLNADRRVGDTASVGSYPGGKSPYGAHDMAGNVWEWVFDWYQAYPGSPAQSPFFGEKYKVVRGGSWNHPDEDARTFHRDLAHPARRIHVVGVRCAQDR